jgi:hypothetical protein
MDTKKKQQLKGQEEQYNASSQKDMKTKQKKTEEIERKKKMQKALNVTTKGLLANIFGENQQTVTNITTPENLTTENVNEIKSAKVPRQNNQPDILNSKPNMIAQTMLDENGNEIVDDLSNERIVVERLLEDKDKTIELLSFNANNHTESIERQYDKTTNILEQAMEKDRNLFDEFAKKIELIIAEKDKTIEKLVSESNKSHEDSSQKMLELQKEYNTSTTSLQTTLNEDRAAFATYTKSAVDEKAFSSRMLQTTIDSFKETINKTIEEFLKSKSQTDVDHQNEITRLTQANSLLQKTIFDIQTDKNSTMALEYLISHSKKYEQSLDEIRGYEPRQKNKLDSIKQSFTTNTTSLSELESSLTNQNTKLEQLKGLLVVQYQKFAKYENDIQTRLKQFDSSIGSTLNGIDKTMASTIAVTTKTSEIERKIANIPISLENEVDQIKKYIDQLVVRINDSTNDLMDKIIQNMNRQLTRVVAASGSTQAR